MSAQGQLDRLAQGLNALRQEPHTAAQFARETRLHCADLLKALPPRYTEVLHNLLDRLESSALFAGDSCSFSHSELLNSLQLWSDKARSQLA